MTNTNVAEEKRALSRKLTSDYILSLGETNRRIELFDGEIVTSGIPDIKHQRIATRLGCSLYDYVRRNNLGYFLSNPVDVVLSNTTVLEPDVSFLSNERKFIDKGTHYEGAPDLVIEILSESTEKHDRTFKFQAYAQGGAKEYWIISPLKNEIEVYQNSETGFQLVKVFTLHERVSSPLFPELEMEVSRVFEE